MRLRRVGAYVALARSEALAVFEHQQLLCGVDTDMAVGADAPRTTGVPCRPPRRQVEDAIAEVGFGCRAQPCDGAAGAGARALVGIHVRCMHKAPARVDIRVVEQPGDRSLPAPRYAVVDLLGLLCDVDVDGRGGIDGVEPCQCFPQGCRRYSAQRVQRQAKPCALGVAKGLEACEQAQHRVGRADKATLIFAGRSAAEAAGLVQHGQQRQADAGALCGTHQGERKRRVVGIRTAIGIMVNVMKFADRRVAGLQHLDVEAERDGFHLRGVEPQREPVHQAAPTPEAVVLPIGTLPAKFGEAGNGTLEGMRMQVGHAGNDRPARDRHAGFAHCVGIDANKAASGIPHHRDVLCPACREQRIGREQCSLSHEPWPSAMRPCRTTVRTGRCPNQ